MIDAVVPLQWPEGLRMGSANAIDANAAKLRALHEAIKDSFKKRHKGAAEMQTWQKACKLFHDAYEPLSFPGGLSHALPGLAANDPTTIEMAVQFLEANPVFFRSGYIKADLAKYLRRATVTLEQRQRLQNVILARVREPARREFRWYCRLAPFVADSLFHERIVELERTVGGRVAAQAGWVLAHLDNSTVKYGS